jgi:hypothetical protein
MAKARPANFALLTIITVEDAFHPQKTADIVLQFRNIYKKLCTLSTPFSTGNYALRRNE